MMDTSSIKKNALTFNRARGNLLLVVAFTLINLILTISNTGWYFLFSATVPILILAEFQVLSSYLGGGYWAVGIFLAFLIAALYFVFWLLSKKFRVFFLVALVVFALDTLILLFYVFFIFEFEAGLLIDLAFSAWVLYYLIIGTKSWAKLSNVSAADMQSALDEATQEAEVAETKTALEELAPQQENNSDENEQ